jgi:protein subunit release factor B
MSDMEQQHDGWQTQLLRASQWSSFIAGGPGGQHRNRNATAVRLVHRPSGMVITATERRSQAANLQAALERLRARLAAALHVDLPRAAGAVPPASRAARRAAKRQRADTKQMRAAVRNDE